MRIRAYPRAALAGENINVIGAGNSHMAGEGASVAANNWFSKLAAQYPGVTFTNVGIGGQRIQSMIDNAAAQVDNRLVAGKINVLFAQEFGNEMANNGRNAAAAHAKWVSYCNARRAAAKAAGKRLYIITVGLHPTGAGATYADTLARIASVQAANALIRADFRSYCDQFIDLAAFGPFASLFAGGDFTVPAFTASGMYSRDDGVALDRVHMGNAGHALVGRVAAEAFRRVREIKG